MNIKALFKIQCGLYVAAVATAEKTNALITNTLMQQSHIPVKVSVTLDKKNLTHDMLYEKRSVALSALSSTVSSEIVKRFGFKSGREIDKFDGFSAYSLDKNGNPILSGEDIAAVYSLSVYDTVDVGTHTMFFCTVDDADDVADNMPITYWDYRERLKNNG